MISVAKAERVQIGINVRGRNDFNKQEPKRVKGAVGGVIGRRQSGRAVAHHATRVRRGILRGHA